MNEPATETVVEQFRRMTITGELAPGVPLDEAELASILKCGRTPLRDAVEQMCHQGLVVKLPPQGILTPSLDAGDFQWLVEAQLCMTIGWVVMAAERIQAHQLDQMRVTLSQQESASEALDLYSLVELDCRFHILIAEATGNPYFTDAATRLHGRLSLYAYQAYEVTGGSIASKAVPGHRAIMEALEKRDAHLAEERVRTHIAEGRRAIPSILRLGAETEES